MHNNQLFSKASIVVVLFSAIFLRFCYFENNPVNGYNATSWDAFGYYMYQPGFLIYGDVKKLEWLPAIDSMYHVTGGKLYQANKLDNGNYVFKYLGGICTLQLPFFYLGHSLAKFNHVAQDGFSWPYQYSIMFGAIFWFLVGMLFLRKALLHFFSDTITGLTILFLFLATNLPQYISIDGAMSHSYIFPMYCFMLWLSIRWHNKPSALIAFLIGLTCGIATISRPTELIMLFIPLLWGCQTKESSHQKWQLVRQNLYQVFIAVLGAFIGVLPQLLYWKYTSGSFVYDVGSKWYFLTPWFRVLFGFYSGWFIYTPITLLFIVGFKFMKNQAFQKSVLTFCLLNIWIVIAWSDWKYGVSYAGRALCQGLPVYAFGLASFLTWFYSRKRIPWIVLVGALLIVVNFYQIKIYNSGIYNNFSVLEQVWRKI
ncbi:MAG: hypothetical protein K1X82_11895 [Bacteroidia bacterium]|nr:hypothetical protein [Bacteroidia bacterium]